VRLGQRVNGAGNGRATSSSSYNPPSP
jgi:hypothetical protein